VPVEKGLDDTRIVVKGESKLWIACFPWNF